MQKKLALAACAALVLPSAAFAADNGFYLGASVGQSNVKFDERIEDININYDADSTGYKLIAGWRFIDWLAVEANWVDLGTGDDHVQGLKIETSVDGPSLSMVGFLPVGPVDLMARVGAFNWNADIRVPGFGSGGDDDFDLTYGIGAQFRVWSISLRAEYERFEVSDVDDVDLLSIGITYTFL